MSYSIHWAISWLQENFILSVAPGGQLCKVLSNFIRITKSAIFPAQSW